MSSSSPLTPSASFATTLATTLASLGGLIFGGGGTAGGGSGGGGGGTVLGTVLEHIGHVILPYHNEPLSSSAQFFFLRPKPFACLLLFDLLFVHGVARTTLATWRALELVDRLRRNCFFFIYLYMFYTLVQQVRKQSERTTNNNHNHNYNSNPNNNVNPTTGKHLAEEEEEIERTAVLCQYFVVMIVDHLCRDLFGKERSFGVFQLALTWFLTLRHTTTTPVLIVAMVDSVRKMLTHAPAISNPSLPRRDTLLLLLTSVDYGFLIWNWLTKSEEYPSFWLSLGVLCTAPISIGLWALSQIVGANVAVISFVLFLDWMLIHFHLRLTESRPLFDEDTHVLRRSVHRGFVYDGPRTPVVTPLGNADGILSNNQISLPHYCEQISGEDYELQQYSFTQQSLRDLKEHVLRGDCQEQIARLGISPSLFDRYLEISQEQQQLSATLSLRQRRSLNEEGEEIEEVLSESDEEAESEMRFSDGITSSSSTTATSAPDDSTESSSQTLLQCVVCLDEKRELMVKPCNHYCLCIRCADRYVGMAARYPQSRAFRVCPVCRYPVDGLTRVYL